MVRMVLVAAMAVGCLWAQEAAWREEGVVHTRRSPHAVLHDVPVRAVRMGAGFWADRMRTNVERSIPTMLAELEQHGIVDNFLRLAGRTGAPRRGPLYTDSDIYKWIEAAGFVLQSQDDAKLRATVDRLTDAILSAQEPSGYLNTYWSGERAAERFTQQDRGHELYCFGHLVQAAVAYYRATGNRKLLDGAIRYANFLVNTLGPDKRPGLTGHPEAEMALVELYRSTGDRRYLQFAGYLLSGVERERLKLSDRQIQYMFSGIPFTSRQVLEGHAVRAMYACSGATDYYMETGDAAYRQTLERLWSDLVRHKMYITGGVGSRSSGEAFGEDYELPNAQAYGESCAAIGNFMWNWRMLQSSGEARFSDVMERALYNGINSGMSLDGTLYCYRNPLESAGEKIRNPWYDTTCCPPNLERTLAALPGYLYNTSARGVWVNLYAASTLDWHLEDGTGLKLEQQTEYPWRGDVTIAVEPAQAAEFSVYVRIPGWSRETRVAVNGTAAPGATPGQYLEIRRTWKPGDRLTLRFDMQPRLLRANPLLRENAGRVAVMRGPLVYCLEQFDQRNLTSLFDASLTAGGEFREEFRPDLLGGVMTLRHAATVPVRPLESEPLYEPVSAALSPAARPVEVTLIPYYAWANRGQGQMEVWVPMKGVGD